MGERLDQRKFSLFCWNIANPSVERAGKQAKWLQDRQEDVIVLTETKKSGGCLFLEKYFQDNGYNVISSRPKEKEFGVIIASRHSLAPSNFADGVDYLSSRVVSAKLNFQGKEMEIIGIYVPSRDRSDEKIERKKHFLRNLSAALETGAQMPFRIFCGDFNILEPNHIPRYSFFRSWEYDFYRFLENCQLQDVFRFFYPTEQEYSWVGRTGNGYRYDHCFVSNELLSLVSGCYYLHEPRKTESRISDHSAIIAEFNL